MKIKTLFLLVAGLLTISAGTAQKKKKLRGQPAAEAVAKPMLLVSARGESVVVIDKDKTHAFDFLMPSNTAVTSRFVKASKEYFYIRYDYNASARAQSYYMVGYRYYNGKIYLRRFANLKFRGGKWSGTTHFYKDKPVDKWATIQTLLTTKGAEDPSDSKSVGIYFERQAKGKMALVHGIRGDALLQKDEQFIALLNAAKAKAGI